MILVFALVLCSSTNAAPDFNLYSSINEDHCPSDLQDSNGIIPANCIMHFRKRAHKQFSNEPANLESNNVYKDQIPEKSRKDWEDDSLASDLDYGKI